MYPFSKIEDRRLRRYVMLAAGLVVVAAIAVVVLVGQAVVRNDNPNLATDAPLIPAATNGAKRTGLPAGYATGQAMHFVVDSGSTAKYVAREQLAIVPVPTNAVGPVGASPWSAGPARRVASSRSADFPAGST